MSDSKLNPFSSGWKKAEFEKLLKQIKGGQ